MVPLLLDSYSDSYPDSDSNTDPNSDPDFDPDSDPDSDPNSHPDSHPESNSDSHSDSNFESHSETHSQSHSESHSESHSFSYSDSYFVSQSVELDANLYKNRPNLKCLCMWSGEGCLIGDGDHGYQFWPQSGSEFLKFYCFRTHSGSKSSFVPKGIPIGFQMAEKNANTLTNTQTHTRFRIYISRDTIGRLACKAIAGQVYIIFEKHVGERIDFKLYLTLSNFSKEILTHRFILKNL